MNYTANKYDCKALLGVALLIFSAFLFTVRAYADDYDVRSSQILAALLAGSVC